MKKNIASAVIALSLFLSAGLPAVEASAQATEPPKRELRSVWLTTYLCIDWPSSDSRGTSEAKQAQMKKELLAYLDNHQKRNFNGVCLQVRSMADAFYKSSYEPWSQYLTNTRGAEPGWDPLAFAVEECHKRGLECWAWINPYRFNRGNAARDTEYDKEYISKGWIISHNGYAVFNPGLEEVRQHNLRVIREIYTNYAVDGILFDDYFYPNDIPYKSDDAMAAEDWEDYQEQVPGGAPGKINDWRRENIAKFVRQLREQVDADRPDMRFGISPAGVAGKSAPQYGLSAPPISSSDWQYESICSDPLKWLSDGSIDFISPQIYWFATPGTGGYSSAAPYTPLAKWWSDIANHFGRHFYSSQAPYRMCDGNGSPVYNNESSWEDLSKQISLNREYTLDNAPGSIFYSAKYMDGPLCSGWGDYLLEHSFSTKSLVPVTSWKEHPVYAAPANLALDKGALSWEATIGRRGNEIIRYTVYAVPLEVDLASARNADGDGLDSKYLLGVSYDTGYTLPADKASGYWYGVCVYDGYGYESEIAVANYPNGPSEKVVLKAPADGESLDWGVDFAWSAVDGAVYTLQISPVEDFSKIDIECPELTAPGVSLDLGSLDSGKRYFWRVSSLQPSKLPVWSEAYSFISPVRVAAAAPVLVSPADKAEVADEFSLTWEASADDVEGYTVEIASDDSFSDILRTIKVAENTTTVRLVSSVLGIGTYYWRVVAEGSHYLPGVSAVYQFSVTHLDVGNFEPGYIVKTDDALYADAGKYKFENVWYRTVGNSNFSPEGNGSNNRGIAIAGDYVYMSGRKEASSKSDIYLKQYSLASGEHIRDINLSADGKVSYLPCNDVFSDAGGNLLIANLVLNVTTTPLVLHRVDPETGELTRVAELLGEGLSGGRVDHCCVYGSVDDPVFYVYAAIASNKIIARWTVAEGKTTFEYVTVNELSPSSKSSFGIAPRTLALGPGEVIVDGGDTAPAAYDFSTGNIVNRLDDIYDLMPDGYRSNGIKYFTLGGKHLYVYASSDHESAGYTFNIISGKSATFADAGLLWKFPEGGMGKVNSTTCSAPVDVATVDAGSAMVAVYVPGNGLGVYRVTDGAASGISDVSVGGKDIVSIGRDGVVEFSSEVGCVEVYSVSGMLLARYVAVDSFRLPDTPGAYIVRFDGNVRKIIR